MKANKQRATVTAPSPQPDPFYIDLDALPGHTVVPPDIQQARLYPVEQAAAQALAVAYDSRPLNMQEAPNWRDPTFTAYTEIPDPAVQTQHALQPLNLQDMVPAQIDSTLAEVQYLAGIRMEAGWSGQ